MAKHASHLIIMGPQGSGKGTQSAVLEQRLNKVQLSTGDLFRAVMATGSDLGKEVKEIYDRGDLIPDALTLELVSNRLDEIQATGATGAIFDGFPRNPAQAAGLDELLERRGETLDQVIELKVPEANLIERISNRRVCPICGRNYNLISSPPAKTGVCDNCGAELIQRSDDTAEAVAKRLKIYWSNTAPLIDYYTEKGLVRTIDGDQSPAQVEAAIAAALDAANPAGQA